MRLSIHEVLQKVAQAGSRDEAVSILRSNDTVVLRTILNLNFHPDVKFILPEGEPPFKKETSLPIGVSDTSLFQEARRLYLFVEGKSPAGLTRAKRESQFIHMLEGLHWTEAELLISLKEKALEKRYPGLDAFIVLATFPGLIPEPAIGPGATTADMERAVAEELQPVEPYVDGYHASEVAKENPLEQSTPVVQEKKPVSPKKLAAMAKALEARKANAKARREAKALAEKESQQG